MCGSQLTGCSVSGRTNWIKNKKAQDAVQWHSNSDKTGRWSVRIQIRLDVDGCQTAWAELVSECAVFHCYFVETTIQWWNGWLRTGHEKFIWELEIKTDKEIYIRACYFIAHRSQNNCHIWAFSSPWTTFLGANFLIGWNCQMQKNPKSKVLTDYVTYSTHFISLFIRDNNLKDPSSEFNSYCSWKDYCLGFPYLLDLSLTHYVNLPSGQYLYWRTACR